MIGSRISSGSEFEELAGYARAVVLDEPAGGWVMVSGTTGYDYTTGQISADPLEQTRQCFRNISAALSEAGASLEDLVRIRVYLASQSDFEGIARIVGEHTGAARPANTTVVCALTKPEMKIEIEVTARKPPR
jgi:enamine deaminase RidA (YjgF/YER057c/UK114 family)